MNDQRLQELRLRDAGGAASGALDAVLAGPGRAAPTFYAELVAVAARRVGSADAADVVGDVLVRLYGKVGDAVESVDLAALQQARVDYARRPYLIRCVTNAAADHHRIGRIVPTEALTDDSAPLIGTRVDGVSPDDEDLSDYANPADVAGRTVPDDHVYVQLDQLLRAMNARHRTHPKSKFVLTDAEIEHLRLMYRFAPTVAPARADGQRGAGQRDRSREQRRRRESRKDPGFDPNWGMTKRVADYQGVDKSTVSARNKALCKRLATAVYLAGVLGRSDAMTSQPVTDEHLDLFERWAADPVRRGDTNTYVIAGAAVRTWHGPGSRVRPRIYVDKVRRIKKDLAATTDQQIIGALHDAETRYAFEVASRFPRCVLLCDWHEVAPDRVVS